MDWPMLLLSLGIAGLIGLAVYGMVTGKTRGGNCGCGTGACGRPVQREHPAATPDQDHDDETFSADNPPEEISVEDLEEQEAGK
jgi:hypothetical protein